MIPVLIILSAPEASVDEGQSVPVCGEVSFAGSLEDVEVSFPVMLTFPEQGVTAGK